MFELIVSISLICIVMCLTVGCVLFNKYVSEVCKLLAEIASLPPEKTRERKARFRTLDSPGRTVSDLPPQVIAPHIGKPPRAKGGFGSRVKDENS